MLHGHAWFLRRLRRIERPPESSYEHGGHVVSVSHPQRGAGAISVQEMGSLRRRVTYRLVVSYGDSFDVSTITACVVDCAAVLAPTLDRTELAHATEALARSRLRRRMMAGNGNLA